MKQLYLSFTIFLVIISISTYSQTADTYLKKGDAFYRQSKYEEAIGQYNLAIKLNSKLVDAYVKKGEALEFIRRFSDAITTYDALLNIMPKNSQKH